MFLFHLSWIQSQFTCPRGFNLYWLFDSETFPWDWTAMQLFLVALSIVSLVWAGTRMKFSPTQVTCAAPCLCLMMRETKPVGLWQLLQCLFEVWAKYWSQHGTMTQNTRHQAAPKMLSAAVPWWMHHVPHCHCHSASPCPLSFSTEGQCPSWHRSKRRDWRQTSSFAFSYDVYRVILHSKNVRNGGGRAGLEVHVRKTEQMAVLTEQNHLLLLFLGGVFLVGYFFNLVPNSST